jgi:hypothetical protein
MNTAASSGVLHLLTNFRLLTCEKLFLTTILQITGKMPKKEILTTACVYLNAKGNLLVVKEMGRVLNSKKSKKIKPPDLCKAGGQYFYLHSLL